MVHNSQISRAVIGEWVCHAYHLNKVQSSLLRALARNSYEWYEITHKCTCDAQLQKLVQSCARVGL